MTWRVFAAVFVSWVIAWAAPLHRPDCPDQEPSRRQSRRDPGGHGRLPRALRRLPWPRRPRRARPRHHPGLELRPHGRGPVQDHPQRRARLGNAGVRRAAHVRSRPVADARLPEDAGRAGAGRAAARQRRERREGVSHDVRRLPQGECHRRPPRSRPVAHRHRPAAATCWWRAFAAARRIFAPASRR